MEKFIEAVGLEYNYSSDEAQTTLGDRDDEKAAGANENYAVRNITIDVAKGEYIAIVGRNGSGKSTFAKMLNLVLEPSGGTLVVDGQKIDGDIDDCALTELRRRIGMVFQNPDNQLVATVVEEDVAFGPENLGVPSAEIRKRVDEALDDVGMREYAKHEPSRLSGGQKQRVAIAGILAMKPSCIIFDESTAMLDPVGRREVVDVMEKLVREGITVINITHHMNEAARASRVIVINGGEVISDGDPHDVFADAALLRDAGLELPQCSALVAELNARGANVKMGITPEECAANIAVALGKVKNDQSK